MPVPKSISGPSHCHGPSPVKVSRLYPGWSCAAKVVSSVYTPVPNDVEAQIPIKAIKRQITIFFILYSSKNESIIYFKWRETMLREIKEEYSLWV
jgi:hypothetical protein